MARRIKGWLDDPHLRELIRTAAPLPPLQLAICLMADAGCRLREALAFHPSNLVPDGLRIWATKTKRWRTVPLTARLEKAIAAAIDHQTRTGSPQLLPINARTLQRRVLDLCHRAGTPLTTPHRLRHSYATRLHAEGVPLATISALMGHKSIAATLGYLHVGENDYVIARRALDRRARKAKPRRRSP